MCPAPTLLCSPHVFKDCFAYHGVGGIVGAFLTGLLASKEFGNPATKGAAYGNGGQLLIELVGIAVTVGLSAVGTTAIFWTLQLAAWAGGGDVRTEHLDLDDLDKSEHGGKGFAD